MKTEQRNYRVLRTQPQFLKLLFANVVSRFGDSLDVIAYTWIMYEVTGSEALMALIMGLNYVPTVFLQPIAGALVDRMTKKRLMVITDVIRFGIVALFAGIYAAGALTPLVIAVLTLCTSTVEAFRIPAGGAFMPMLLEKEHYTVGKAANYSLSQASQLVGLMLAGGMVSWLGAAGVLWIDGITFGVSALVIAWIKIAETRGSSRVNIPQVFADFKAGLAFLKTSKTVQTVSLIGLVINFGLMPLSVFQTPYVYDYLKMGPEILSLIKVLMVAGMMTGAAVTPKLLKTSKARLSVLAGIAMGAAIAGMYIVVLLPDKISMMTVLILSMFLVGTGGGMLNVIIGGSMMSAVPKPMLGRMSALNGALMQASMPLGSFLCSALVIPMNVVQLFLAFGLCTIAFYVWMGLTQRLDCLDEKNESDSEAVGDK